MKAQKLGKQGFFVVVVVGVGEEYPSNVDVSLPVRTHPPCHAVSSCLCRIGTAGIAVQVVGSNWPKPHYTLLITGLCRFSVSSLLKERPFVLAEVKLI